MLCLTRVRLDEVPPLSFETMRPAEFVHPDRGRYPTPLRYYAFSAALTLGLLAGAAPVWAAPILFPATPQGPAEVRDERDVAPYLSAWKAESRTRTTAYSTVG